MKYNYMTNGITISTPGRENGLLQLNPTTGKYEQLWRGQTYPLNQAKVVKALRPNTKAGRPKQLERTTALVVYVTQEQRNVAKRLGEGNASAGVRIALESAGL
jgi:hypothetical protein